MSKWGAAVHAIEALEPDQVVDLVRWMARRDGFRHLTLWTLYLERRVWGAAGVPARTPDGQP